MTLGRKDRRAISVDSQQYFWAASGDSGHINLRVAVDVPGGQHLCCTFSYTPVGDQGVGLPTPQKQFVVTPAVVRRVIQHGLLKGWTPLEGGGELRLGQLDALELATL